MDPEIELFISGRPKVSLADVPGLRASLDEEWQRAPAIDFGDVVVREAFLARADGSALRLRLLGDGGNAVRPAVLSLHAGAMAVGRPEHDDAFHVELCRALGVVVVAPEYRLAPENPYPAALEDCYSALTWMASRPEAAPPVDRIAVLGDSGGATLAASVALLARDRGGPRITFQALVEPPLDSRMHTWTMQHDGAHWATTTPTMVRQMWDNYLAGQAPSAHSVPAAADDLSGLPPTYLSLPELDAMRDEGLEFAQRLQRAGVPTEIHCWPGAVHGFLLIPCLLADRARRELVDAIARGLGLPEPSEL